MPSDQPLLPAVRERLAGLENLGKIVVRFT